MGVDYQTHCQTERLWKMPRNWRWLKSRTIAAFDFEAGISLEGEFNDFWKADTNHHIMSKDQIALLENEIKVFKEAIRIQEGMPKAASLGLGAAEVPRKFGKSPDPAAMIADYRAKIADREKQLAQLRS